MQAQDSFGVARRPLDVEDYIDIARRHRGWIFGPLFAAIVISVVGAYLWPDTYVSNSVIKVVPQQIPEEYVQSNVNQMMTDRVIAIEQQVLSRDALASIIKTRGLYPRDLSRLPLEDVVEMMRKKITISPVQSVVWGSQSRTVPAFTVEFSYTDRTKARDVVADITGKLIAENLREQEDISDQTTSLLRDEWTKAKAKLDDLDNKLAEFRSRNQGHLPDEQSMNIQEINALEAHISNLTESIMSANNQKLMFDAQLKNVEDQLAAVQRQAAADPTAQAAKNERVAELDQEIQNLENRLTVLREQYKDSYPDVQTVLNLLNTAKKQRAELVAEQAKQKPAAAPRRVSPQLAQAEMSLQNQMRTYRSAIEAKNVEIEGYRTEMKNANAAIQNYQSRLDATPSADREYTELMRDHEIARQNFMDIDGKMTKSAMAQEMMNRKYGESLELLDPALLPQTPSQPDRPVIIGIGSALGLFIGIVFAGAREMKDTSLKNLKDVRAYTQLPILGSVPLLENDLVVKRRRRIGWLGWSLALLLGIAIMSGSIIYYYVTTAQPIA
jgi:protein tyrosine kinase modulator